MFVLRPEVIERRRTVFDYENCKKQVDEVYLYQIQVSVYQIQVSVYQI
jgi:hypothetical protein